MATLSDAVELIPDLRDVLVMNSNSKAILISESQTVKSGLEFESETWTYEQLTEGPTGKGMLRLIGSHVENVVYMVACSSV